MEQLTRMDKFCCEEGYQDFGKETSRWLFKKKGFFSNIPFILEAIWLQAYSLLDFFITETKFAVFAVPSDANHGVAR